MGSRRSSLLKVLYLAVALTVAFFVFQELTPTRSVAVVAQLQIAQVVPVPTSLSTAAPSTESAAATESPTTTPPTKPVLRVPRKGQLTFESHVRLCAQRRCNRTCTQFVPVHA